MTYHYNTINYPRRFKAFEELVEDVHEAVEAEYFHHTTDKDRQESAYDASASVTPDHDPHLYEIARDNPHMIHKCGVREEFTDMMRESIQDDLYGEALKRVEELSGSWAVAQRDFTCDAGLIPKGALISPDEAVQFPWTVRVLDDSSVEYFEEENCFYTLLSETYSDDPEDVSEARDRLNAGDAMESGSLPDGYWDRDPRYPHVAAAQPLSQPAA